MFRLNSKQLRECIPTKDELEIVSSRRRELYLILDNVLDTFNIGGFFRLADAVGIKKMWLCGKSECPPNHRIDKASVGTHRWVAWEYHASAEALISSLKQSHPDWLVLALEQYNNSIPLSETDFSLPMVLVVGHESTGLSESVINRCDQVIELPMYGVNTSVNVLMAAAMVYGALEKQIEG